MNVLGDVILEDSALRSILTLLILVFFLIAGGASWILKTFFRRLSGDRPEKLLDRHPGRFQPIVGAVHHREICPHRPRNDLQVKRDAISIRDRPPFFLKAAKTTVVRPLLFRAGELKRWAS